MFERIHRLTPEGKADYLFRKFLTDKSEEKNFKEYDKSLAKYRKYKSIQLGSKILLYASIITSIAASFNFNLKFISTLASFIGPTLLLILYAVTSYISKVYKEELHVQRDILLYNE
jgi:hypothetical protein